MGHRKSEEPRAYRLHAVSASAASLLPPPILSLTACNSFAAGQRMCVGFNFALQEIKIFMCLLVWRYKWLKEGDPEADYDPFFQLIRPINLYVRTKKREVWPSKSDSVMT
jgi:cytochrome P450